MSTLAVFSANLTQQYEQIPQKRFSKYTESIGENQRFHHQDIMRV